MYVYRYFNFDGCYTVGFYTPSGEWIPESDHTTSDEAADRVASLNGGIDLQRIEKLEKIVAQIQAKG